MNTNSNDTTLIFKNIPKQIDDVSNFLQTLKIPPKDIKPFGRKRVLINYELKDEAENALNIMGELEFDGRPINISLFRKDKPQENKKETPSKPLIKKFNKSVQTVKETVQEHTLTTPQISKYVQKLYATDGDLGFDQPPPPYLKYSYPPINKDIMDNICISLLSNKRFYTQVLHLMNRMNLEPPFIKREYKFTPPGVPHETATQTEEVVITEKKISLESSTHEVESELETSEEEDRNPNRPQIQMKRKLPPQPEQYKKKAKQILQTTQKFNKEILKKPSTTNLSLKEIFETPEHSATTVTPKIELQLKRLQKPPTQIQKSILSLPADLSTQKLPTAELESLSIYKNYQKGQASNKLYIKNLHKDVTSDDLRLIYERFITNSKVTLDIKAMQHGRMKGQAFVTFVGDDTPDNIQNMVAQALEKTNGFIIYDKPMVVCYGKRS